MKTFSLLLAVLLCSFFQTQSAFSQIPQIRLSAGFTTQSFMGDQIAANSLVARDSISLPGASFNGQQLGASLKAVVYLDADKKLSMPIGLDYVRFFGAQRLEVSQFYRIQLFNSLHAITPTLGVDYSIFKLPLANASVYAGAELRGSFFTGGSLIREDFLNFYKVVGGFNVFDRDSLLKTIETNTKPNTFRLGGAVKVGVEGKIQGPMFLNISLSYGSPNLFGRDNARGELFTPNNTFESQEGLVTQLFFHFMVQYRL